MTMWLGPFLYTNLPSQPGRGGAHWPQIRSTLCPWTSCCFFETLVFVLQEIFSYFECEHYTCRVKFCTRRARDIHEMCHDEVRDMQFFCFQCGYRLVSSYWSISPFHLDSFSQSYLKRSSHLTNTWSELCCRCQQNLYLDTLIGLWQIHSYVPSVFVAPKSL